MNSSQNNIDIEKRFLEEIATKYQLFDEYRRIFLCRFDRKNAALQNKEIADDKHLGIDEQELQKYLRSICDLFGHKANKRGRPKSDESPWKNVFDDLWNTKFNEWLKLQQNPNVQIPILDDVNWLEVSHKKLENQQQEQQRIRRKTSEKGFEVNVHVPLGLVERKQQQRRDENNDRRDIYKLEKEVIAKIYEHNDFLEQVINQNPTAKNKHIAIVGEPGAGKTTLLSAIASYIKDKTSNLPIFISLGSLGGMKLEEYILKKWLPHAMRLVNPDFIPTSEIEEKLKSCFSKGGVWLLLDGVDEMGESSPRETLSKISQALTDWLGQARVVLTCRLNVWDASLTNNELPGFDTYKTREFKPEQVDKFIEEWFKYDNKIQEGEELKAKLRQPGKERILELVTNPLRLSLLCQIFYNTKHSDLPETKAELFGLYTQYFYDWKRELLPENFNYTLKQELHQALGKLALAGINIDARFRLKESFAIQEMGQDLFDLACNVGWLNLVDRDARSNEPVYAFFHPNFQEYFAALVIDDWHYFLNHVSDNPDEGIYRVFEAKWKEVMLMWIGRNDILPNIKDEFMLDLSNFEDGCKNIFKYNLLPIVTKCLREFPGCSLNTISWEDEEGCSTKFYDMWEYYCLVNPSNFWRNEIEKIRCSLIRKLGTWMHYREWYDSLFAPVIFQVNEYEKNKEMIKELEIIFQKEITWINSSGQISDMVDILICNECHQFITGAIVNRLVQICREDQKNILYVTRVINCNLNFDTLEALLYIYQNSDYYDVEIVRICIQLLYEGNNRTSLVAALEYLYYASNNELPEFNLIREIVLGLNEKYLTFLKSQKYMIRYWYCYSILLNCSKNMTYPEFYRAWHGNSTTIKNLESQFKNTHTELTQLQPTNKTYPLILNLQTLQDETENSAISQEICNQIYFTAFTEPEEIPEINNAPQLKRIIHQLKKHLQTENIALIINNCEPNQEMIKFCQKLTDVLHIAFITQQPLNPPLRGFPKQSNLLNVMQNWICEIE